MPNSSTMYLKNKGNNNGIVGSFIRAIEKKKEKKHKTDDDDDDDDISMIEKKKKYARLK